MGCVFFFKKKTAYEMRIRDWSSDVCSSYLLGGAAQRLPIAFGAQRVHVAAHLAGVAVDVGPLLVRVVGTGGVEEGIERHLAVDHHVATPGEEIGRASCRERVCRYVQISEVAVHLKKTTKTYHTI